ncbi:hypothetical protein SARC_15624, partial [Sphaeroforma arctica JP610]
MDGSSSSSSSDSDSNCDEELEDSSAFYHRYHRDYTSTMNTIATYPDKIVVKIPMGTRVS